MGKRRFWGSVNGWNGSAASSEASRGGSTGISGHIRGEDVGVYVSGTSFGAGQDLFSVYATGGSNDENSRIHLGNVTLIDGIPTFRPAAQS